MSWLIIFAALAAQVPETSGRELTLDMHERFAYAAMMRTAVIHGYPDRAKRHAGQLSELLDGTESQSLADIAGEAARAADDRELAVQVARVGEACGACHASNRVQPFFASRQPQEPTGESLAARMGRHIWAADRMWEGLVSHSLASWQAGAKLLARDPFLMSSSSKVPAERVQEVSDLATEAAAPGSWNKRAEVYGRFLATCVGCHEAYSQ
ncbi:MAG: hypothetical protein QNJ40_14730 [Xanthomonadales bacterium]|nr:hypothetical protein [Xanthomonadales bacterium]